MMHNKRTRLVDHVLECLQHNRIEVAEWLFPDESKHFWRTWEKRSPYTFWKNLSGRNQVRLVDFANTFYIEEIK